MKRLIPEIIEPWFFVPNNEFMHKAANDFVAPKKSFLSYLKKLFRSRFTHANHSV